MKLKSELIREKEQKKIEQLIAELFFKINKP